MTPPTIERPWLVFVLRRGEWEITAGRHAQRRTAVISQQWAEYVEGYVAVVARP